MLLELMRVNWFWPVRRNKGAMVFLRHTSNTIRMLQMIQRMGDVKRKVNQEIDEVRGFL